jgi:hypothetical protein
MTKLYRKKGTIEVERWTPGIDMAGVSIGDEDRKNGSPRDGDRIATNPDNPRDRWLIAQTYFEKNYEPAD